MTCKVVVIFRLGHLSQFQCPPNIPVETLYPGVQLIVPWGRGCDLVTVLSVQPWDDDVTILLSPMVLRIATAEDKERIGQLRMAEVAHHATIQTEMDHISGVKTLKVATVHFQWDQSAVVIGYQRLQQQQPVKQQKQQQQQQTALFPALCEAISKKLHVSRVWFQILKNDAVIGVRPST
eukprot:PhF_6_TR18597/c0_g1_i1/m.27171